MLLSNNQLKLIKKQFNGVRGVKVCLHFNFPEIDYGDEKPPSFSRRRCRQTRFALIRISELIWAHRSCSSISERNKKLSQRNQWEFYQSYRISANIPLLRRRLKTNHHPQCWVNTIRLPPARDDFEFLAPVVLTPRFLILLHFSLGRIELVKLSFSIIFCKIFTRPQIAHQHFPLYGN